MYGTKGQWSQERSTGRKREFEWRKFVPLFRHCFMARSLGNCAYNKYILHIGFTSIDRSTVGPLNGYLDWCDSTIASCSAEWPVLCDVTNVPLTIFGHTHTNKRSGERKMMCCRLVPSYTWLRSWEIRYQVTLERTQIHHSYSLPLVASVYP